MKDRLARWQISGLALAIMFLILGVWDIKKDLKKEIKDLKEQVEQYHVQERGDDHARYESRL